MKKCKISPISLLLYFSLILFTITLSIALPIFIRPFYYLHIDIYNIEEFSGLSKDEITEAYDDVLDYLTLPTAEFSTGSLRSSDDGKAHFEDCKKLFTLNSSVLILSLITLFAIFIFCKKKFSAQKKSLTKLPSFWAGITTIALPTVLGVLVSLNPDRAFVIFHKIFFPGKDNWIFDPRTDEIITILPQEFFINCAALIGISLFTLSVFLIVHAIIRSKKKL